MTNDTNPADLTGAERGHIMHRARHGKDPEAKATLAKLTRSRKATSDAVRAAQTDPNPLGSGA